MKKANLSIIYVDGVVWCTEVWPEDLKKYVDMAKKENPTKKITINTQYQDIYNETDIENMTEEDKEVYLA